MTAPRAVFSWAVLAVDWGAVGRSRWQNDDGAIDREDERTVKDRILGWIDTLLIVDFFVVLLSLLWLAIAVVGRAVEVPLGLDWWYALWEPVFTPALGLLMGGALLSGLSRWIARKLNRPTD